MLLANDFNRSKESSGEQFWRLLAIACIGPDIRERIHAFVMPLYGVAPCVYNFKDKLIVTMLNSIGDIHFIRCCPCYTTVFTVQRHRGEVFDLIQSKINILCVGIERIRIDMIGS